MDVLQKNLRKQPLCRVGKLASMANLLARLDVVSVTLAKEIVMIGR